MDKTGPLKHPTTDRFICGDETPPEVYQFLFSSLLEERSIVFATVCAAGASMVGAINSNNFYGGISLISKPAEYFGACWYRSLSALQEKEGLKVHIITN